MANRRVISLRPGLDSEDDDDEDEETDDETDSDIEEDSDEESEEESEEEGETDVLLLLVLTNVQMIPWNLTVRRHTELAVFSQCLADDDEFGLFD